MKFKCPTCGSSRFEHPLVFNGNEMKRDTDSFKCLKCGAMCRKKPSLPSIEPKPLK